MFDLFPSHSSTTQIQPRSSTLSHAVRASLAGMEEYPEELRTPPVALVSLVGSTDHHHATISAHLHAQQPPINVLALPDFSKIPVILNRKQKEYGEPHAVGGILKRDWLVKHRTRVPAVVAAIFAWEEVNGDPAQWSQVCTEIDKVKDAVRLRNVKLVVVVVQSSSLDDMSEDRMIALRKRADIDSKHLIVFSTNNTLELKQSLDRLAGTFSELVNSYYKEEGRRIKTRVEKKNYGSIELHVRYCFKVAVYAEFRREWSEAFRFYDESYRTVREMIGSSTRLPPIQRLVQIKSVAEQLHFKMSTLLLHGGKTVEAVTSFRQHNTSYKRLVGSAEAIHLHWEWMSRQFLVFAELLETSSAANQSVSSLLFDTENMTLTEWEFRPAYYYQLAAQYLKRKRSALEVAISMWEDSAEIDSSSLSVVPSVYVGQFARLLEQGDLLSMQSLTDEDYIRYAVAEGKRFHDSYEIIALLKRCYEFYGSLKVQRMGATCGLEIAKEYFSVDNFSDAKQLFDSLANLYRQEGWVTLLWEVLGYLRECSRKLATVKDFVEYSLEMAALPVCSDGDGHSLGIEESSPAGPPSLQHRENIHKEVLELVTRDSSITPNEINPLKVTEDNPLHLEIDLVSPLRSVLLAAVAFHEQSVKPGASTSITVSLLSQLPLQVEIDRLDIQFNQSECNFTIVKSDQPQSAGNFIGLQNHRVETAPSLSLSTNKWLRLTYDIRSEQSGKLECISIFAKLASHFTIFCRAESPASMDDLPLWRFEDRTETFPTKDPALAITGQKAIQVEEAEPLVDVNVGASGPAFVGERFIVPITIVAREHHIYAGELKFNLVDIRGSGLFSPQEAEPSGLDSYHVELLGISGAEGEETGTGLDKVNTIQQSFGLVSVPDVRSGDSWSCKLEIRWHRPKSVTLFVSLGYCPHGNEFSGQKIHVHKSLQIEGKNAIAISHRFLLPFRRDPLLISGIKKTNEPEQLPSLPINEKSIVIVSTRNCTEVPLQLESFSIKADNESATASCSINPESWDLKGPAPLLPGEEYKKVFTVCPQAHTPMLRLGSVHLKWRRDSGTADDSIVTEHKLPDIRVELPPLTVSLECPPYAILGDPCSYYIKICNQTHLLQEVKFSMADSQSFVMSGPHSSTVSVLPKADHILAYKLVPLASGLLQLPKVMLTSVRYSAAFQSSADASSIFAYPSKPCFKIPDVCDNKVESVQAT